MRARKILIVDDDATFRSAVQQTLGRAYFVTHAASEADFRRQFRPYTFDLIILDMRLESGREGLQLLREILSYDDLQPVIMVSAYGDTDAILDSAESGAMMFLHKQEFTPELLARMVEAVLQQAHVRRHLAALQSRILGRDTIGLAGKNPAIRSAMEFAQKAADDPECTVLVAGEHGTGHELVAQLVHDRSRSRSNAPLVMASGLSARSDDFRSILFGSPRRGGTPRRKGLLEQSNGGVLFFDRLELLAADVRASLIEALRRRTLKPGPSDITIPLDFQLVAATGADGIAILARELQGTSASERLVEIYMPPLRERREDIPVLAAFFLQEFRQAGRTSARTLSSETLAALEAHPWPANLPELRNIVEFGALRASADDSEEIALDHMPANFLKSNDSNLRSAGNWNYRYYLARTEVKLVQRAVEEKGALGRTRLAEMLNYTDRFAFGRRIRKALADYPDLARDFPKVGGMFGVAG